MKQFFLTLLLPLIWSTSCWAQQTIANGDFEAWRTNGAGTEVPQHWLNTEEFIAGLSGAPVAPTNTVRKTTFSRSGSFAVQLSTQLAGSAVVAGTLVLGDRIKLGSPVPGGKPFTARPTRLNFHYILTGFLPPEDDSASVTVFLSKWDNGTSTVVGGGNLLLTQSASSYTLASIPMDYQSAATPDSVHIMITSGTGRSITVGTVLTIDDLSLDIPTAAQAPQRFADLSVFPNPTNTGLFTLQASQNAEVLAASLLVTDLAGRVVLREAGGPVRSQRIVDLRQQPAGLYSLRLLTKNGPVTRTLVVQ
jgi:hypothetical protein